MAQIKTISKIANNGVQSITIHPNTELINHNGLWHGFDMICCDLDYKHNNTTMKLFRWIDGIPIYQRKLNLFRDEILSEQECLKESEKIFEYQ